MPKALSLTMIRSVSNKRWRKAEKIGLSVGSIFYSTCQCSDTTDTTDTTESRSPSRAKCNPLGLWTWHMCPQFDTFEHSFENFINLLSKNAWNLMKRFRFHLIFHKRLNNLSAKVERHHCRCYHRWSAPHGMADRWPRFGRNRCVLKILALFRVEEIIESQTKQMKSK